MSTAIDTSAAAAPRPTVLPKLPSARHLAELRMAAARAMTLPGLMILRAHRLDGRVVDFGCEYASAAVARLLFRAPHELVGEGLLDLLGGKLGHAPVFVACRRVVETGLPITLEQPHVVNGVVSVFRHEMVRCGDGVAVTLTNLTATARADAVCRDVRAQTATAAKALGGATAAATPVAA